MQMRSNPVSKAVRAVWNMRKGVPLTLHLMKDTRMGRPYKIIFLLVVLGYLLFPYDFIFDFPFLGQLDDLAILLFMMNWFIRKAPRSILEEYGWHDGDKVGKAGKEQKRGKKADKGKKNKEQTQRQQTGKRVQVVGFTRGKSAEQECSKKSRRPGKKARREAAEKEGAGEARRGKRNARTKSERKRGEQAA